MIGYMLSWAIACVLVFVGLAAGLAPRWTAAGFGLRAKDPSAEFYVRATGSRDIILGLTVALLAYHGTTGLLARALALGSLIALADLAQVLFTPGARRSAGVIHAASALMLLITTVCLQQHR
jgi:hypothetical protein